MIDATLVIVASAVAETPNRTPVIVPVLAEIDDISRIATPSAPDVSDAAGILQVIVPPCVTPMPLAIRPNAGDRI